MIPYNKPFLSGSELAYIQKAVESGKISGDGDYTKKCHHFLEEFLHIPKTLLTTSCTDALELSALLLNIQPGDEVVMPSYTFVSTANAFYLRGAKLVFIDSRKDHPGMDESQIEEVITSKTKAIVPVHYAGIACDMEKILEIAQKTGIAIIEDAAQAIDSYYKEKPLGSFGDLSAFSFHETKNIISGEGGMLGINNEKYIPRAEILREKGTNRSAFFRGEVDKYNWVDLGSSFLPSEIVAAFLYAQLEHLEEIQGRRKKIWNSYYEELQILQEKGKAKIPVIPEYATQNGHIFYLIAESGNERDALIQHLKKQEIHAVFHYLSLHKSPFYSDRHDGRALPEADRYSECLIRLPLYFELSEPDQALICKEIKRFYGID